MEANSTIFIATDEKNSSFFDPLRQHYNLLFLNDFKDLIEGVNSNYMGMLDQRVASRGRTFIGAYFSTFTGKQGKSSFHGAPRGMVLSYIRRCFVCGIYVQDTSIG